jgi:tRNA 2-thiouridine synthesizing protein A
LPLQESAFLSGKGWQEVRNLAGGMNAWVGRGIPVVPPGRTTETTMQGSEMETQIHFDRELDARGLNCPLPILRTKKSLNDMKSGQVLKVLATDPGSVRDFQAFSKQTGNQLLSSTETGGLFLFFMRKK